jgi:hypothetical protein
MLQVMPQRLPVHMVVCRFKSIKAIHSLLLIPPQHCCAVQDGAKQLDLLAATTRQKTKLHLRKHILLLTPPCQQRVQTPGKSRYTTGLTVIRRWLLGSDRSPFLNRGVSRATFHAAGTWLEHRAAQKRQLSKGAKTWSGVWAEPPKIACLMNAGLMPSSPVAELSRVRWIAHRTAVVSTGKDGMVKQVARPPAMTLVCGSY